MKMKYSIYIILYTFLFVYFPPLLPFNTLHILTIYSFFRLIRSWTINLKLIINSHILSLIKPLIYAVLYLLCVSLFTQNSIMILYPYLLLIIEIPICVIYLYTYFIKHQYDIYNMLNLLLIVGFIQAIIAILSFFVPSFKDVIIYSFMNNTFSNYTIVSSDLLLYMYKVRLNGLSSNLAFTMPVVQTILGLISLYLTANKNYKYIFLAPILLFSAIINARSSFVVLLYGGIILILMLNRNLKTLLKFTMIVAAAIIVIPLLMQTVSNSSDLVSQWVSEGFNETITFIQGQQTGYYESAMTDFIRFPEGLSIIFGTGKSIFGLAVGSSDIGYIDDIWLGGLLFLSIAYFAFISYYVKAYKNGDKLIRFIMLLLISTFLIMNIKGSIVSNNEFINISVLLSTVFISEVSHPVKQAKFHPQKESK